MATTMERWGPLSPRQLPAHSFPSLYIRFPPTTTSVSGGSLPASLQPIEPRQGTAFKIKRDFIIGYFRGSVGIHRVFSAGSGPRTGWKELIVVVIVYGKSLWWGSWRWLRRGRRWVELHVEENVRLCGHHVRQRTPLHSSIVTMDPRVCNEKPKRW